MWATGAVQADGPQGETLPEVAFVHGQFLARPRYLAMKQMMQRWAPGIGRGCQQAIRTPGRRSEE